MRYTETTGDFSRKFRLRIRRPSPVDEDTGHVGPSPPCGSHSLHHRRKECSRGSAPLTIDHTHPRAPAVTDTGSSAQSRPHLRFFAMSLVWLSVVCAVARGLAMDVLAVGLGRLLLAIPRSMSVLSFFRPVGVCVSGSPSRSPQCPTPSRARSRRVAPPGVEPGERRDDVAAVVALAVAPFLAALVGAIHARRDGRGERESPDRTLSTLGYGDDLPGI